MAYREDIVHVGGFYFSLPAKEFWLLCIKLDTTVAGPNINGMQSIVFMK